MLQVGGFMPSLLSLVQQTEGLLNFFGLLINVCLPLMKNVLKPLPKSVLVPLGLTAIVSAADAAIFGSETTLTISDEEMNDIMKIVKSLEDSDFLVKGVSKTIKK